MDLMRLILVRLRFSMFADIARFANACIIIIIIIVHFVFRGNIILACICSSAEIRFVLGPVLLPQWYFKLSLFLQLGEIVCSLTIQFHSMNALLP